MVGQEDVMGRSTVPGGRIEAPLDFAARVRGREPVAFRHGLADEPELSFEAVTRLADELGADSVTSEAAVKPILVPDEAAVPGRVGQPSRLIADLERSESWLTLLNIEQSPRYRRLVDDELDALATRSGLRPRSWRIRSGFIFTSSPGSVTPAHFDIEHSLLLQLRGNRTLHFGDFTTADARASEIRRYWNGSFGRIADMPIPRGAFEVGPGDGVYIPPYTPHWLINSDAASLSLTLTFFDRSNDRESCVQVFDRRFGRLQPQARPRPASRPADEAKYLLVRVNRGLRSLGRTGVQRSGSR
jgi:hypothetical protein